MQNPRDLTLKIDTIGAIERIQRVIENYLFTGYGIVTKYTEGYVDIKMYNKKYTSIEVLSIGSQKLSVQYELQEGDIVLILASQSAKHKLSNMTGEEKSTDKSYSIPTFKAIPITFAETSESKIVVDRDGNFLFESPNFTVDITKEGEMNAFGSKSIILNGNLEILP